VFVLHPDPYLQPCFRISPFQTKDIHTNNQLANSGAIDDYFKERFKGREYIYVTDGRKAINTALQQYQLQPDDVVTIFTTSGNFYISSCVTREIEKFCKWSRQIEDNSRLIFVNHEFGYPYKNISQLQQYNLPIIEDCAHSFFSTNTDNSIGTAGDFTIYSFPKMFPLQTGGLLTAKEGIALNKKEKINEGLLQYIKNVLSHYIGEKDDIIKRRLENYHYLVSKLTDLDLEERFECVDGIVPGVFMFRVKNEAIELPKLKEHLYAHGIQCSVFYGERSFFIPVHQNLSTADLDYFSEVIHSFPVGSANQRTDQQPGQQNL
jgi:DegT/DnrJ/EryC1/StrS aminotransferase family